MPSSSHPADLHIASHIRLACEDLRAANALFKAGNRYTAYHLEQAVEKLMLAVLVAENVHVSISESHRLDVLLDKIPVENPMRDGFQDLTHLTVHATSARYPKTGGRLSPEIDFDTVPELSAAVKDMIRLIVDHFDVDPAKDARTPARVVEPPRRSNPSNQ
jgi:HEPN domain-containing protein